MLRKPISLIIIITFVCSLITPTPKAQAQNLLDLPEPGTMVSLSPVYEPALIKGLTVHKDNPFLFDFIVDTGNDMSLRGASATKQSQERLKAEGDRLIKYFFASLTIPDKDLWVNLSPYEKDRMIPKALGQTAMGRDLLAQDYMLKQLTASLIYPEKALGKSFWDKVYAQAREQFGTTNIPVNTFNKVWIVAQKAKVYEHNQTAFIVSGHLKVMLEEDYLSLSHHVIPANVGLTDTHSYSAGIQNTTHTIASQIIRSIILPAIEQEVNTGKNFATLRQIFYSQILATWFKRNLKQALLSQVYADKSTVKGVNLQDPSIKEKIYQRYLQAYKKGAYNYIKEETDPLTQQIMPRKYFSGGFSVAPDEVTTKDDRQDGAMAAASLAGRTVVDFAAVIKTNADAAMDVIAGDAADVILSPRDEQMIIHALIVSFPFLGELIEQKSNLLIDFMKTFSIWDRVAVSSREVRRLEEILGVSWMEGGVVPWTMADFIKTDVINFLKFKRDFEPEFKKREPLKRIMDKGVEKVVVLGNILWFLFEYDQRHSTRATVERDIAAVFEMDPNDPEIQRLTQGLFEIIRQIRPRDDKDAAMITQSLTFFPSLTERSIINEIQKGEIQVGDLLSFTTREGEEYKDAQLLAIEYFDDGETPRLLKIQTIPDSTISYYFRIIARTGGDGGDTLHERGTIKEITERKRGTDAAMISRQDMVLLMGKLLNIYLQGNGIKQEGRMAYNLQPEEISIFTQILTEIGENTLGIRVGDDGFTIAGNQENIFFRQLEEGRNNMVMAIIRTDISKYLGIARGETVASRRPRTKMVTIIFAGRVAWDRLRSFLESKGLRRGQDFTEDRLTKIIRINNPERYVISSDQAMTAERYWEEHNKPRSADDFRIFRLLGTKHSDRKVTPGTQMESLMNTTANRKYDGERFQKRIKRIHGQRSDQALLNGGIDLSALNNGLSITKDANGGVTITVDPTLIEHVRREGIKNATPVIVNMRILPSVDQLLGL